MLNVPLSINDSGNLLHFSKTCNDTSQKGIIRKSEMCCENGIRLAYSNDTLFPNTG